MTLLYFAWVREKIGHGRETCAVPDDITTLNALLDWLSSRSPGHSQALKDRTRLRFAVNQDYATLQSPVCNTDEVAIFPPVTGG